MAGFNFEDEMRRALDIHETRQPVEYEDDGQGVGRIKYRKRMGATGMDLKPPIRTPMQQAEPRDMTVGEAAAEIGTATAGMATGAVAGAAGLIGDAAGLGYGAYKFAFPDADEGRLMSFANAVENVSNTVGSEAALNLINSVVPVESMPPEMREAYEQAQTAGTFVGLGKAGKAATAGAKQFIADAPARVRAREADTGVTLGAGVDPTPAIDKAIVKAQELITPSLSEIEQQVRSKYPNVDLDFYGDKEKGYTLSKIIVPKDQRQQGVGQAVMKQLTEAADEEGAIIKLSPSKDFGATSTARLKNFYKSFGFVENKGKYKDFTIKESMYRLPTSKELNAAIKTPKDDKPGIIAFHGSGADFDEFKLEKIGTGEGAQAYGYGLYFTDSEDIAKFYRDSVGGANVLKRAENIKIATPDGGQETAANFSGFRNKFANYYGDNAALFADRYLGQFTIEPDASEDVLIQRAIDLMSAINESDKIPDNPKEIISKITLPDRGKTYKVSLEPKPEDMLDYDKVVPSDVVDKVMPSIKDKFSVTNLLGDKFGIEYTDPDGKVKNVIGVQFDTKEAAQNLSGLSGELFLKVVERVSGGDKQGAEVLSNAGIPGIKYRAAGSRGTSVDDAAAERNYVVFDDKMIKILEKYGIVGPVSIAAMNAVGGDESEADNGA